MIKSKKNRKIIAIFLTLNFLSTLLPYNALYASNNGPNAPEASNFEPVSATDMVNLSSGDMAYVLPLLEIDGFPVTLSYHAGIPMEMEASWTGLGWNINTGSIARGVVGTPDDWLQGSRLNLTYLQTRNTVYTVDVGYGFPNGAEVGVGLSWGPNKSLSGSVSLSAGPVSASMDTDGNYSIGVSSSGGFKDVFGKVAESSGKNGFGGSLSVSGNVNRAGLSVNASAGGSYEGMSAGMGVSVSGNGVGGGFSIGASGNATDKTKAGAGGGMSVGSFTAGDFNIASSGFYIPLQIGVFSFGFGMQKQTITLFKIFSKYAYGSLYHDNYQLYQLGAANNPLGEGHTVDSQNGFIDYQRRDRYGDMYEQELPQDEINFTSDYRNSQEKLNFGFAGYDSYSINASGVSGSLRPLPGENTVLMGEGYEGDSPRHVDMPGAQKMKVYYHNSKKNGVNVLKPTKSLVNKTLHFAFDGHITQDVNVQGNIKNNLTLTNNNNALGDLIDRSGALQGRAKEGSYTEVFTNAQIDANQAPGLLTPTSLHNASASRSSLGYDAAGIGGYKVTTPDGKTYHFAQPVYQYEQIQHSFLKDLTAQSNSPLNSSSKREATPYATHWLLTAITGPDFIDDGNNYPDDGDLGYWLRLDHGQWSNAYAWRSPYDTTPNSISGERHYSSYVDNDVEKSDQGYFLQGRKDLYYLDKIVSRTNVAYFVKDIRKDGKGTSSDYDFNVSGSDKTLTDEPSINEREYARYETEYQLKLDKIVIENRKTGVSPIASNAGGSILSGITSANYSSLRYFSGGYFDNKLPAYSKTHRMHQAANVIDVGDFSNYDYSRASKVIKFGYDYSLAKDSPNSDVDPNSTTTPPKRLGKLSLKSIKTYGRGMITNANESQLFDYMPPYQFTYHKTDVKYKRNEVPVSDEAKYIRANKDSWGFIEGSDNNGNNKIDAWSLASIKTPQGSSIDINYEEDDFYVEAFSRKYWQKSLMFRVASQDSNYYYLEMIVDKGFSSQLVSDFDLAKYFSINDRIFLDLWLCRRWDSSTFGSDKILTFDVFSSDESQIYDVIDSSNNFNDMIKIKVKKRTGMFSSNGPGVNVFGEGFYTNRSGGFYSPQGVNGPNVFITEKKRGECPGGLGTGADHWSMKYKVLATKSPMGINGGGLKVKEIVVKDQQNNKYITEYDYTVPGTTRSSGVTSFYPVYGETFVPYQNELPGPGVMYEWVTMKSYGFDKSKPTGQQKVLNTQKRYHFYTLKSNFDIFNPNIEMKDIDGDVIFKATVTDKTIASNSVSNQVEGKEIRIEKNLTKIGQLISVEDLNADGTVLSKTTNSYVPKIGKVEETFTSMKSVYDFDFNSHLSNPSQVFVNPRIHKRLLSVSTKSEKTSILRKVTNTTKFGTSTVEYSEPDPYLGSYRSSIRTMSDGTKVKETKYPAYERYTNMGPKWLNASNKNMLTQEAMHVNAVEVGGQWKTTHATVTTWNNDWQYRDASGNEPNKSLEVPIWRKHKGFVYRGTVDSEGTYGTLISPSSFNWGLGATQTNANWQQVSEITRYNHFSVPYETKDMNNNFASSKMADNWKQTVASGNARYTEMYSSGVEFPDATNVTKTEDEFTFSNTTTSNDAHTGKHSVSITSQSQAFKITGDIGSGHNDLTKKFRPGKYKVSFWSKTNGCPQFTLPNEANQASNTAPGSCFSIDMPVLMVNGVQQTRNSIHQSGNWYLHSYIIDLPANTNNFSLYLKSTASTSNTVFVDDYRMHPVYASMNTYVYNPNTNELQYILDGNNLGMKFSYDFAGRLCRTFKEVVGVSQQKIGGFKLINKYNYNYKDSPNNPCGDCCDSVPY